MKKFRKEFKDFFYTVGMSDSFRPTGDCSIHEHFKK